MNDQSNRPVVARRYLSLSHAQRAIWTDMRLADRPLAFQLGAAFTFRTEIDPDLARQALRTMIGRHEAMRLRVDPLEPRQWLETGGPTPFRLTDVSDAADPAAAADARIADVQAAGFALGEAPLFKVELIKLAADHWRMLLLCHHLVFDGVSLALAQREWLYAYRALAGDDDLDARPPARSSYAEIVEADEAYQASPRYEEDMAYWRDRLAAPPAPIFSAVIAADHDGPEPEPFRLDAATLTRLEASSAGAGATLHQALVSLFALALARRYGRDDFLVGVALHRREAGTRHVIGCLAGLMALRCKLPPATTPSRAVASLAADLIEDLRHQRAPIDAVARALAADPSAAHAREGLFDAVVTIMPSFEATPPTLGGRWVEGERPRADERSPLALHVNELPGRSGLALELRARRGVLPARETARFQEVLIGLIEAFAGGEQKRSGPYDGLAAAEAKLIRSWRRGASMTPPEADLAQLFERVAAQQPEAPAAVSDAGALSYAELDRAANRLALRLKAQGLAPGAVVGVAIRRSLASPVAILGVLKAEGVYLPLDPDYPAERLARMIEDAGAQLALTTPDVASLLPDTVKAILFDGGWPLEGEAAPAPARGKATSQTAAYIVFTSGSTGRPKGVAVSHGALINLAWARRAHDPIGPGDRILAAISIGFDVSLGQLLTPLLAGATVAVAGDIGGLSASAFWEFVARHGVSHVNSVPSFFASVLDAAPAATSLKQLMLGGEPLSGALAMRLRQRLGAPVINMYGPTEACIDATCYVAPAEGIESVAVLPIGRPLPNYTTHVLDAAMRLCPIGCVGELYIGGPSLAQGYVGQPELTAERFVETPDFGRLYRTGDRAAWGEDGQIRFLGRVDAQVKIRGFRVELGEIEAALAAAPGVAQAAVVARPDARGDLRLLAYYVGGPDAETLRAALRRRLPSHMVPSAFTPLDALPLTINGKLDERALPEPRLSDAGAATAPRTATERLLVEAFAEVFPGAAIGVESHFFDLGGHSLLATQLATRLRKALGLELPLKLLFEQPRLVDLAREIDAMAPEAAAPMLVAQARPDRLPLSPAQERLWFLAQMDPQSPAYNIPVALRVAGRLDEDALARALLKLTDRHEALRTRFCSQDGLPYQEIATNRPPGFLAHDLTNATEADIRAAVEREALRPFDLECDPLLRATLVRVGTAGVPPALEAAGTSVVPTRAGGTSAVPGDLLLLTIHHIVADGASMFVLLPELAALYNQERTGARANLPPLPVQFADYALWRRDPAFAEKDEASLAYWRQALEGAPEALALPTDFPRPERAAGAGESLALDLGPELSAAVQRFAREQRATPFVVLAAAWAALLARWSGQDEVVIGAPLANRNAAETADMVGFLVNTIALRATLDDAPDFATLVARLRERMIEAHAHGELPFERVVAALAPARSLGRNPIFQAMFALQPAPLNELDFAGLRAEPLALMERVAKFDLTLNLTEAANGFSGALTYASDLFAGATIARMAAQFRHLLREALQAPATRVDRLPLVDAAERAALVSAAEGPRRPLRRATIPELFAERVALHPEVEAVAFGDVRLSYARLDAAADRLAQALIAAGAAGRPVAAMLQRSEALVTAALAVMKAGAIYTPIDPATPDARVAAMLADAAPAVFLADQTTRARAPAGLTVLDINQRADAPASAPAFPPEATAYLIYTSGSTGTPKGVAVSHAALAALADARLQHDPIGPGDRVLATMSVGFDVSLGQLVTPLLSGATVVIAPDLKGMSGADFWALTASQEITHVNSGPAFFDAAMETPPPALSLKRLMLGGEAFPVSLARKIAAALPEVEIYNMYGPTEACIDATSYRYRGDESGATLPIGRALPNYRVIVLDETLAPTPPGIAGEIFIGGPSLAEGYLNRPEETAQRFVQDPFGAPGERLYRTGDRARRNGAGEIEFLGRIDAQVKIRGFRIEPDEVAAVLRRQPEVAAAVVVAHARGRETCLVAYVAPSGEPPAPALLRARASAALPAYMVPAAFVVVPALPMTINGKLDLKALPAPDFGAEQETPATPPRDAEDARMLALWRDILGDAVAGVDTNFFAAGGHSLLAMRLIAEARKSLGLEIPVAALFRLQTVRALVDALAAGEIGAPDSHGGRERAPALAARPRPPRVPLSSAQERLWFLAQLDPLSPAYNIPLALRIAGRVEPDALARALEALVARHESLRTRILAEQGLPYQDILASRAPKLDVLDLFGASESDIRAVLEREILKPFDLERDPLLRATLVRTGTAGVSPAVKAGGTPAVPADILLLTIHHIVADGASTLVLLSELTALYAEHVGGAPADLSPLPVQFADYALWRRDPAFAARDDDSLAYWRLALEGAPEALTLPTDLPRPERASGAGDSLALDLGADLSLAVQRFARERRATPFVVLAAAWAALLARWSGQDDVVVGAPLANRNAAETADMVGFLVNTIALRAKLSEAPDFATLVARLGETMLEAHAHGELPFDRIVEALAPARSLGRNPIFQAMFSLLPAAPPAFDFAGLRAEPLALLEKVAKFDLTLSLAETSQGFSGALTYATDLFKPATMQRMAAQFRRLLREALAAPSGRLDRLALIEGSESAALIAAAAGSERAWRVVTIPALFAERVALQPDAEAVVFGETRLTYAALDKAANRLARALIGAGVGPERPVAVMLRRRETLSIAALGVMKAGGVYLPIDPANPDARVAAILTDAAPALLLADAEIARRAPPGLPVMDIDSLDPTGPDAPPEVAFGPDATAYLIYTSGSTGTPKGVAISHAALAHLAEARLAHDPIGPGDRDLATASIGFDVSVGQIVTPLLAGATVVVAPELSQMSGPEFWALVADKGITHLNTGPAFLDVVLDSPRPPLALKRLLLGGESLPTALARRIAAVLPGVELLNIYGPTETCIDATFHRFHGQEFGAALPIGRPLANYRVLLLDEALTPTPDGLVGEIFIGGPGLAKGYLNRPDETAQRFVQDPFGKPGERLYRTGDRARRNARGEIEFLGRIDAQVKIRGFRIEPEDIAAVLRRQPEVAAAAVVAHMRGRETFLVAYVAPSGEPPAPALLHARAAAALPAYMVPAAFVVVPSLPMTINGKLDLKALPAPEFVTQETAEPTPPRDERDAGLIAIWRELLESERIGIDDNFFRLGGHSLLAMRFVAAVKARLDIDLPIAEIYRSQTIRALADAIGSGEAMKQHGPLIKLGDGPGRPIFAFHPVGGGAFGFIGLAEAMEGRRPVYGVQAAGLEAGETLAATFEEMALSYLHAIRARQPFGPYAFIGHSFGGVVAFEITRRLEAMGETVERLVMIDSSPPGEPWTMELAERLARRIVRLERERTGSTDQPIDPEQEQRVIAVVANNMRLAETYAPSRIATPMTYLLARRGDLPPDGRRAYWESWCEAPIDAAPLECDHFAVLNRDNARSLQAYFD